jgi:hypothetical protein
MPVLGTTAFPTGSECFSLVRSLLNDADLVATSTITQTGAVRAGSITTITTAAAHGLQIGDTVQVAFVSDVSFNGTFTVLSVPGPTSFAYQQAGAADASSGNGVVQVLIQGDVFTDNVLLNFANKAYRKLQNRLQENGSPSTSTEVIITLPIGTTQLTDTTNPQLPPDFLAPREIHERITGNPFFNNRPMSRWNMLPSVAQQTYNGGYAWFEDGLQFIGSLSSTDIRLRYFMAMPDISSGAGQFTLRGCLDVIADWTAFLAASSRGSTQAGTFATIFEQDIKEFLNTQAHARQYLPGRRRSFNSRGRSLRGCF